jgi:ADP-heptose:LPS heptosyltransferase
MTGILVARLDSEGDVLLAGPAVRAAAASGRGVTMLCGPRGEAAARLLPGVDAVLVYEAPWIVHDPPPVDAAPLRDIVAAVRDQGCSEAAILTSFHQNALPTALVLRLAGVGRIAAISEDYPGSLLDVRLPPPGLVPEAERALAIVQSLGHDLPDDDVGDLRVDLAGEPPATIPGPYVVLHPGASVPARAWPARRHRTVARRLAADGLRVVVTGSAGERSLTAAVAEGVPGAIDLGGRTTLPALGRVLQAASAVVVGNTGPAHLAAAVGTPVVSIFAATVEPERWRPWLVAQELLHAPPPCAGCRARICPLAEQICLDRIGVGDVTAAVLRLLALSGAAVARPPSVASLGGPS